jgi:hypothetical protein
VKEAVLFGKKEPKNFYYWRRAKVVQGAPRGWEGSKSFLVLFFKKEPFPY